MPQNVDKSSQLYFVSTVQTYHICKVWYSGS